MGKTKLKNRKPEEHAQGEIRSLKKEVKRLQQEIKQLQKQLGYSQNKSPNNHEPEIQLDLCPECAKGIIKHIYVADRTFIVCELCKYRKKL